mgnify:FL=1
MILTKVQSRFVNSKSVGFTLLKGKKNTGKTMASIKRAINLENNYCIYPDDKVLYITEDRKNEIEKIYNKEFEKNNFYSLFSVGKKRVEFLSLTEIISMYAKGYYNGKRIKLISDEEAFQILKGESFNELYNEYSKKSKLLSKMDIREIFDEILWIKSCGFTIEEYQNAIRKGRKRIIRKCSFSREYLYSLMEVYNAQLMDMGYKDKYDDVLSAIKYARKHNHKYSHIIFEEIQNYTRAEIELVKELSNKEKYSSVIFTVGDSLEARENLWLVKGRKLKELGADFKGKTFNFKTVYEASKKETVAYMNEYKYLNLKNKSILEFKVDDSSIEKEIYLNEENIDEKNLKEIPVYNEIDAGQPIEINDEKQENFYLPKEWVDKNNENFILKIKGDSMIEKNIDNGDLVVIRRQNTAYQNDIVAISLNGEATLKILKYNDGIPTLMPANALYSPISLIGKEAEILGVAIGVIKKN